MVAGQLKTATYRQNKSSETLTLTSKKADRNDIA
jgi:hypothetical protein